MVVTAQSASAGLKPSADADEFNVASGTIPGNEHWASLPQAHGLVGEKESHTAFPNTDSGYGSTTSSPELNRESTSTSLLIDKAMNLKERIFPREKKVLKHYSRTLTPVENARYADLRILFGYALSEWLLNHKRPSAAIEMRIAVMGETETSTELFILVACQKPIVKIVRQFFAQKAIKDELQPSNKVWPKFEVIVRQQLALYSGDNRTTARVAFNSDFDEDRGDLYGTRILLKSKGKSRVARLGGCLWIENSHGNVHCYGLTVGHIHSTPPASPDEETSQHSGERYEGRVSSPIQGQSEVGGTRGFVESSHDFSSETDDDYDDAQDEDEDGYEIPCWGTPGEVQVSGWEPAQASFVRFIGDIIDDDTFTGTAEEFHFKYGGGAYLEDVFTPYQGRPAQKREGAQAEDRLTAITQRTPEIIYRNAPGYPPFALTRPRNATLWPDDNYKWKPETPEQKAARIAALDARVAKINERDGVKPMPPPPMYPPLQVPGATRKALDELAARPRKPKASNSILKERDAKFPNEHCNVPDDELTYESLVSGAEEHVTQVDRAYRRIRAIMLPREAEKHNKLWANIARVNKRFSRRVQATKHAQQKHKLQESAEGLEEGSPKPDHALLLRISQGLRRDHEFFTAIAEKLQKLYDDVLFLNKAGKTDSGVLGWNVSNGVNSLNSAIERYLED